MGIYMDMHSHTHLRLQPDVHLLEGERELHFLDLLVQGEEVKEVKTPIIIH